MKRSNIEYCDHTMNVISGCRSDCEYCHIAKVLTRFGGDVRTNRRKFSKFQKEGKMYVLDKPFTNESGNPVPYPFGFEPTYHKYRYDTLDKLKMGYNVYVGALTDMFGEWIPGHWIDEVMQECGKHEQHNYLFMTQNPKRYSDMNVPDKPNFWYGTRVTCNEDARRVLYLPDSERSYVVIDPILEPLDKESIKLITGYVKWIIIGADTRNKNERVVPDMSWIRDIVVEADFAAAPVFMRDSLIKTVSEKNMRRDYPKALLEKRRSKKLSDKMEATCMICQEMHDKNKMVTLSARVGRRGTTRVICTICRECWPEWCSDHKLESYENELWED